MLSATPRGVARRSPNLRRGPGGRPGGARSRWARSSRRALVVLARRHPAPSGASAPAPLAIPVLVRRYRCSSSRPRCSPWSRSPSDPRARLRDVVRRAPYLARASLVPHRACRCVVLAVLRATLRRPPAIALGLAAAPLLYVVWANSRFALRPALDLDAAQPPSSIRAGGHPTAQRGRHIMTSTTSARATPRPRRPPSAAALRTVDATSRPSATATPTTRPSTTVTGCGRPTARFGPRGQRGWTTSFWPGMLWLAWELTGDDGYLRAAHRPTWTVSRERVARRRPRDPRPRLPLHARPASSAWRRIGDEDARAAPLLAPPTPDAPGARAGRHHPGLGRPARPAPARAHDHRQPHEHAAAVLGQRSRPATTRYADAARRHAAQLRDHILRPDGTTFHTFYWDPRTGEPLRGATEQGSSDDSCWARGQAWGIYGFSLNYRYTADASLLEAAATLRRLLPRPPAGRPRRLLGPRVHRRQRRGARQLGGRDRGERAGRARRASSPAGPRARPVPGRRPPHPRLAHRRLLHPGAPASPTR